MAERKPPSETSIPQKTQSDSTADVAPKPSAEASSKQGKYRLCLIQHFYYVYHTVLLRV
jgi:hypothetical protein